MDSQLVEPVNSAAASRHFLTSKYDAAWSAQTVVLILVHAFVYAASTSACDQVQLPRDEQPTSMLSCSLLTCQPCKA